MNTADAKKFFTNLYTEIWQKGLVDKMPSYYHSDVEMTIGTKTLNYAQVRELIIQQQKYGKQMRYQIHDLVADTNCAAIHLDAYDYLQKNLKVIAFFYFQDGKIFRVKAFSNQL